MRVNSDDKDTYQAEDSYESGFGLLWVWTRRTNDYAVPVGAAEHDDSHLSDQHWVLRLPSGTSKTLH